MARSRYIYIVLDKALGQIYGAFTVKYEMVAYLVKSNLNSDKVDVLRVSDGSWSGRYWYSDVEIEDFIND